MKCNKQAENALWKGHRLVGISSSSQQNVEQSFLALCGGLNAGARS
jgi:hypothetical protein